MNYKGFEISFEKYPRQLPIFPQGVFYGTVDKRGCTAPHCSEEHAMNDAIHQLEHGGLAATLKTAISVAKGWIRSGYDVHKSETLIKEESALLAKVEALPPSHHDSAR